MQELQLGSKFKFSVYGDAEVQLIGIKFVSLRLKGGEVIKVYKEVAERYFNSNNEV